MVKFNNILSYILGGVFIFSSFSKAISISGFGMVVDTFMSLLGLDVFYGHGIVIGWGICLVELILGAMMYPKVLRKIAIGCITAMLMVFTYITYINITSLYGGIESCGCFGEIIHFTASQTFYKNIVLLAISCYLLMVSVVKPMRMLACFFSLLSLSSCMDSEKVHQTITRQHIDNAFEMWRTSKYAKGLSFDDFKEYLLPYRFVRGYGFLQNGAECRKHFGNRPYL